MKVLPDTSIWVEFLRLGKRGKAWHLDTLLRSGTVVTCGPVVAELLTGASPRDRDELWLLLQGLQWSALASAQWYRVGQAAGLLHDQGQTVPLTDVAIAVAATSYGAAMWTQDGDFTRIAHALPDLQLYREP